MIGSTYGANLQILQADRRVIIRHEIMHGVRIISTTRQDIFSSADLHVTERFTRVDENPILYRFTVEDPSTWTRPWSGELLIRRMQGPIFEYACHEGNYGLRFILSAARAQERAAE